MTTIDTIQPEAIDEPTPEVDDVEALDTDEDTPADTLAGIGVVQVDPATVKIEANVRTQVALDAAFVRTIKRHGVLIPVLAYQEDDGTIVVRDGQRRVLAAVQAGRTAIPAYLVPARDEARLRIIQQMIANEQRSGLTETEEAAALHQLTLEGLTPTMIAKELAVKPARVKAAVAVAANEAAKAAVAKFEVTFEQALVIAEFEGDPDAGRRSGVPPSTATATSPTRPSASATARTRRRRPRRPSSASPSRATTRSRGRPTTTRTPARSPTSPRPTAPPSPRPTTSAATGTASPSGSPGAASRSATSSPTGRSGG